MTSLTIAAPPLSGPETRPMARSPMRNAFTDLSKALAAEDLGGARKAYGAIVTAAPDGAQWKPDSAFAEVGRKLAQGDLPAAAEAAKTAATDLRGRIENRRPPAAPVKPPVVVTPPPTAVEGNGVGKMINLVA